MLNGMKIIDFTSLLPGPFATMMLADLGADVLHIVRPGTESMSEYLVRSKKMIELDLKEEEKKAQLKEILQGVDVVIEQFRPGVMERLGFGYEDVKRINPSIIYCSISGYGQNGPFKERAGHDINYLSLAGLSSQSGTEEDGPANMSTQLADIGGGSMHAVVSILAAYIHRQSTGEGQRIDISMTDTTLSYNALVLPDFLNEGKVPSHETEVLNGATMYGFYRTMDGRYFSVGSLEPNFRIALCEALELEAYISLSMSEDPLDQNTFKELVREAFASRTYEDLLAIFKEVDACVEPVLSLAEVFEHPQIKARNLVTNIVYEDGKVEKQLKHPIVFSNYEPRYRAVQKLNALDELVD